MALQWSFLLSLLIVFLASFCLCTKLSVGDCFFFPPFFTLWNSNVCKLSVAELTHHRNICHHQMFLCSCSIILCSCFYDLKQEQRNSIICSCSIILCSCSIQSFSALAFPNWNMRSSLSWFAALCLEIWLVSSLRLAASLLISWNLFLTSIWPSLTRFWPSLISTMSALIFLMLLLNFLSLFSRFCLHC